MISHLWIFLYGTFVSQPSVLIDLSCFGCDQMNFLPDELQYVLPELERRRIRGVHAGLLLLFTRVTCLSHVISGHVTRISLCSPRTFAILLRGGRGNGGICGISGSVLDERNKFVGHSLLSGRNVRWPRRMLPLVSQGEYVDETDRRTDERRAVTLRFPMWTRPVLDVHKVSALGSRVGRTPAREEWMNERTPHDATLQRNAPGVNGPSIADTVSQQNVHDHRICSCFCGLVCVFVSLLLRDKLLYNMRATVVI